ncbi:DUF4189 domain-containing protein [Acuticoccus sediminis]|uniref:DUF4189 domain-containing protein n=1 Tax=Acuticoccus sediminis TaxID=2184697 RepID=UPI0013913F31|nr:DUF4189 domain-containing protein [Acuticoccus sediminis]
MKGLLTGLIAVALWSVASAAGAVANDTASTRYGAVGLDPKSLFVGFVTGVANADDALARLEVTCDAAGATCTEAHAFHDQCAALARAASSSATDALGLSVHDTRAAAQQGALAECQKNGGEGCNIHDTYCAPADLDE